jgi:hypothetical protein
MLFRENNWDHIFDRKSKNIVSKITIWMHSKIFKMGIHLSRIYFQLKKRHYQATCNKGLDRSLRIAAYMDLKYI